MSKKTRDLLFWFFIIIFIASTIIVSLYASGYKINLNWPLKFNRLLIKTGILALDTNPRGAVIYLNDQPQTNSSLLPWKKEYLTTPAKIKNTLPGEYDLNLKRNGYWPFRKKINVYSGQTTFVEDINLFRADSPLFITTSSSSDLKLSPSHKYLYSPTAKKIITLKTSQERILPATALNGEWLKNNDKLLINGFLFDPEKTNDLDYSQLIGPDAGNWHYDENANRLYYQNKNSLGYLEMNKKTVSLVLSGENYLTYEPHGEELFLVASGGGRIVLKKYSFKTQKIEQETELPGIGRYRFVFDNRKFLALYDDLNKTLYLIDPANSASEPKTIKNIASWHWLDDDNLFYNNSWEIYLFNLKQNSVSLLTRMGEEISQIVGDKNNTYLVFSTAKDLRVLDLKNSTITTIFQAEKISSPVLDDKNNTLYFWAQINEQEGIYRLLLQ